MVENLKRFREPAAWLVIGLAVITIGIGIARPIVEIAHGVPLARAFEPASTSVLGLSLLVVVCAAVLSCVVVRPTTPKARTIVLTAAIVVSIGTVASLVFLIGGLLDAGPALGKVLEAIGGLVDVLIKSVGAALLWTVLRRVTVAAPRPVPSGEVNAPDAAGVPPTWAPGQAAGVSWRTAGEAASGAAATSVGHDGAGWSVSAPAALEGSQSNGHDASALAKLPSAPQSRTGTRHSAARWAGDEPPAEGSSAPPPDHVGQAAVAEQPSSSSVLSEQERAGRWQPARRSSSTPGDGA